MKIRSILISAILIFLLFLSGCGCDHQWLDASCSSPQRCELCGETNGEALQHQWSPATCQEAEKCALCGEERGEALLHKWEEADCLTPEKCSLCGEENGEALGHSPAKAEFSNLDFKAATGDYIVLCDVCGDTIESGSGNLKALHDGEEFLCSCVEWFDRILTLHKEDDLGGFGDMDENEALYCLIYWNSDLISRITYKNSDGSSPTAEDRFSSLYINLGWNLSAMEVVLQDLHYLHSVPVMVACDPLLTHDEALELYQTLMRDSALSHNGLSYELFYDEETASLTMSVSVE